MISYFTHDVFVWLYQRSCRGCIDKVLLSLSQQCSLCNVGAVENLLPMVQGFYHYTQVGAWSRGRVGVGAWVRGRVGVGAWARVRVGEWARMCRLVGNGACGRLHMCEPKDAGTKICYP